MASDIWSAATGRRFFISICVRRQIGKAASSRRTPYFELVTEYSEIRKVISRFDREPGADYHL